jgi:integrase
MRISLPHHPRRNAVHIRKYEGKTGVTYQAIVKVKGKSDSATFPSKAAAREWGAKREHEMLNELYFPEKTHRANTLGDVITRYRERILPHLAPNSIRVRKRTLAFWEKNLGDTHLHNITPALVDDNLYILDQRGLAPKSVNTYREILSILFNLANSPSWNMTKNNPMKFVKRRRLGPERLPMLSLQQQQDLLNSCKESRTNYLYLAVLLCLRTGARHQEALMATWSQVNWMQKTIRYINTKGKVDRVVPLDGQLYRELKRWYDSRELLDNPYIFCNPKTKKPYNRISSPYTFFLLNGDMELYRNRHLLI